MERAVEPYVADSLLARRLATEAGALLLRVREEFASADRQALRDAGDAAAQRFLADELASAGPDDAVLSEEAADDQSRLTADRVWIIDPLDGTREFAEGRHDWAVHVALWSAGELIAGAVALPASGRTLATDVPHELPSRNGEGLRIAVSRSRAPRVAEVAARELGAELVPMGSAGFKVAAVLLGEVDAYVHAGGQFEWDSAAPVAVARAAGLHTSRLDGAPLLYNRPDPYLPDVIVCRPELASGLLTVCTPASR
jgi:3'(2'), 5'-bisphosphate nucleotidase